jgi:signal transduction histidine kinase
MKMSVKSRTGSAALVVALAAVLVVLAVLQYSWSGEVSEAAGVRMQANLHAAMLNVRLDFTRELAGICTTFASDRDVPPQTRAQQYSEQLDAWKRTDAHPGLIAGVYVWEGGEDPHFLHLNGEKRALEATAWPQELDPLRQWIQERSANRPRFEAREILSRRRDLRDADPPERRRMMAPWMFVDEAPALVSPILDRSRPDQPRMDWLIVVLDAGVLRDNFFAELAERYFHGSAGLSYRVAVVSSSPEQRRLIYTSDSDFGTEDAQNAEASMNLFGPPGPGSGGGILITTPAGGGGRGPERREGMRAGGPHIEMLRFAGAPRDWLLVVQHRNGSLESVVAGMRRRNLAISFGVLLVLAITMTVMVVSSQRAQRLAKMQMDFVAAVSHELRTPLAVISSAAENIADGVVDSREQMTRYGRAIKSQARQLIQLVEQVLLFAATGERRNHHHVRPLTVDELVKSALDATSGLVQEAGFTAERQVEPGLPRVIGDLGALSQCLQNLITNAVKYGGDARWIGILARRAESGEIEVSVEDKGPGIAAADLERIFEPFYRSESVAAAQIHGTGLGLPLAKSIAEAMGGRLTVASQEGRGSCFTLHLPAMEAVPEAEAEAAKV